jgi:hypothetical protein
VEQSPVLSPVSTPRNNEGSFSASRLVEQSSFSANQASAPRNGEGSFSASQLVDQSSFSPNQASTPRNGEGSFSASQLVDVSTLNSAGAGGSINTAQLVDDVSPPSFAGANPAAMFGPEIDISAPSQISILPPQPVRNPIPPKRIDTSFMTPELVLVPVDLSTLRERNPQVQLTPDQWSLFALMDGQVPLQGLCQALNAPAEQVCMVAGELIAIGLVMPLNPPTGAFGELMMMSPAMAPNMSPSAQYPVYTPQPAMPTANPFASSVEMQAQRGNSYANQSYPGWQQGMSQPSAAYAPVGGYR